MKNLLALIFFLVAELLFSQTTLTCNFKVNLSNESIPAGLIIGEVRVVGNFNPSQIVLTSDGNKKFSKLNQQVTVWAGSILVYSFQYDIINPQKNNRVESKITELIEYPCNSYVFNPDPTGNYSTGVNIGRLYSGNYTGYYCFNECADCYIPTPVAQPNPYILANDFIGIERYLARSISMDEMVQYFRHEENWFGKRLIDTPIMGAGIVPCTNPCDQNCLYKYCPEKYKQDLNLLTDLNAAFIRGVVGYYDGENTLIQSDVDHFISGADPLVTRRLLAIRKAVKDINRAYDASQLRRPIVEAFVPEKIFKDQVPNVKIPKSVISLFSSEIVASGEANYYFVSGNTSTPKDDLKFDYNKIVKRVAIVTDSESEPYLINLQAKMWVFFVCKQFIDMGYTAIQLSQISQWSKLQGNLPDGHRGITSSLNVASVTDTQTNKENFGEEMKTMEWKQFAYELTNLVDKVREYARSNNKFILLSTQADRIYYRHIKSGTTYTKQLGSNGKPLYIFDYNGAAMRPREVNDQNNVYNNGRNLYTTSGVQLCSQPTEMTESTFNSVMPGCNNCLKAIIDPCSGIQYERNGEGWSPRPWANEQLPSVLPNGRYFAKMPHLVYFDGGAGVDVLSPSSFPSACLPWTGDAVNNQHTYGYDDSRWFTEFAKLGGPTCINNWLNHHYIKVKSFDFNPVVNTLSSYYLDLPGRILNRKIKEQDLQVPTSYVGSVPSDAFRLADPANSAIKSNVINYLWKVLEIDNNSIYMTYVNYQNTYTRKFSVINPDRSSIYTWHILYSNGTWAPVTYGTERIFVNSTNMSYTVYLRQDNLGLPPSYHGTKTVSSNFSPISESPQLSNRESLKFSYYPNPVNDELYVELQNETNNKSYDLYIFDSLGKLIRKFNLVGGNNSLNVSDLENGIYYSKIFNDKNEFQHGFKFVYLK